mmetsp:Transcript_57776/g.153644  ORF Transcript_57776/g.153644 Transcript_57776/m.153644 type:complete len:231 (+) Transcript_57776:462-1154(+)
MTFMPHALASFATSVPMPPVPPMRPRVLPPSSKWGTLSLSVKLVRSPLARLRICGTIEQLKLRMKVSTNWATASLLYAGQLQTVMPLAFAAARSTLLNPVPASWIKRTLGGNCSITWPGTGISLEMTMSHPSTSFRISSGDASGSFWETSTTASNFPKSRAPSQLRRPEFIRMAFGMAPGAAPLGLCGARLRDRCGRRGALVPKPAAVSRCGLPAVHPGTLSRSGWSQLA